ncbi:MAG: hypothetical protein A2W26_13500, partial [Acidobacteria bacterium RBG_16_64_8]
MDNVTEHRSAEQGAGAAGAGGAPEQSSDRPPAQPTASGPEPPAGRRPALGAAPDKRLIFSLALNLVITLLQVAGGIIANSLGLLSDAAHNLSDVVALGLSLWAVRLGRRAPTPRRTFAYKRAEILVALFNSAVLVAISVYIIVEAVRRLIDPQPVDGLWVIGFAAGGLVINGVAALLLRSHHGDLNLRSAFLHLIGDAVTSLGVLLSGVVVYLSDWNYADAIVSILVSLWIGREAFRIVRTTVSVLMEGTPEGVEFAEVERTMLGVPGVRGVHDLHIWSISSSDVALSAHVEADDAALSQTGS